MNLIRHAELINRLSSMMLTNLDVLNDVETIKLAKSYTLDAGEGEEPVIYDKSLPANIDDWERMVPEYTELPGWKQSLQGIDSFEQLPVEALGLVRTIEQISKQQIEYVSVNNEINEGILRIVR